ncbi:MAG: hypothetical protein ACRENP_08240 [Longimicrobiales bacterium]
MRSVKLLSALAVCACTGSDAPPAADTAPASAPTAEAPRPRFTMDHFRGLHWLAGNWKGTMPNGSHFFESYRVVNDSTIQMYAHADSTLGAPTDSARIYFSDGTIYDGPQAVVDRIDENGVRFTSTGANRYVFVWKSTGPDSWTATLGANGETTYHMTRLRN